MPGLTTGTLHGKLGIRAGNTGLIDMEDVRVPVENRIGEEGEGFLIAMSAIDQGRYTVAAGAVGLAQACLDASVRYAHERETFGEEIGRHQLVKQMIANMAKGTEIGRLLVFQAGALKNRGLRNTRETSLAKWHATDHSVQAALDAIQIHGANGYSQRVPGRALPAQQQGRRHLRGHEPAAHPHPGRLRPGLPRGPAPALRAVARPGLRARLAAAPRWRAPSHRRPRSAHRRPRPPAGRHGSWTPSRPSPTRSSRAPRPRRARLAAEALNVAADPDQVLQLRLVLRAFDSRLANLLLTGRAVRFRRLDLAGRERYLLGWSTSRIPQRRAAYQGLKRLLAFLAYADPGEDGENPRPGGDRLRAPARAGHRRPVADRAARRPLSRRRRHPGDDPIVIEADAVVVGSGAGGGVVAADLAWGGRSVVVLEAGPFVPEPELPVDELAAFDRLYLNHGLNVSWDASIMTFVGGAVGGGTLVNWMTCIAPPAPVRARWAAHHGVTGFDDGVVDADVSAIERELGVREPPNVPPKDSSSSAARRPWARNRARRGATASTAATAAGAGTAAAGAPSSRGSGCTWPRRGGTARGSSPTRRLSGSWSRTGAPRASRPAPSSTASGAGSWSGRPRSSWRPGRCAPPSSCSGRASITLRWAATCGSTRCRSSARSSTRT